MSGYHFFLISGYFDILDTSFFLDTWIIGYLDIMHTWISCILGYTDTWIHGYPFSLDTWILGYFGYQIFSLSRFWISYPSIQIFLGILFKQLYMGKRQSNSSVKIILYVYFVYWHLASLFSSSEWKNLQAGALFVRLTFLKMIADIL